MTPPAGPSRPPRVEGAAPRRRLWRQPLPGRFLRLVHVPFPGVLGSVRVRLTLWYVGVLALVLALFSVAVYTTEQQALLAQLDSRVHLRLQQLAGGYDLRSGRLTAAPDAEVQRGDEVVLLLTPQGRVAQVQASGPLSSKAPWNQVVESLQAVATGRGPATIEQVLLVAGPAAPAKGPLGPPAPVRNGLFRFAGLPVPVGGPARALLVVGLRSDVATQMAGLAGTLETVAPLILVLCAGGGYWLAHRALRPVRAITRAARQIGETDLSRRLNLRRGDELGELSATFDLMLDRLEAAFARQRQFTADASHELRTPLAVVDLEATRALSRERSPAEYHRALAVIQQENARMARLVDDLLTLARAENGRTVLSPGEVDLVEVILDAVERLTPWAHSRGITIIVAAQEELPLWGDRVYLAQAVANLVENALTHGEGVATEVRVEAGRRCHEGLEGIWLHVGDNGPGIAAVHLPHLFERFYRVDPARTLPATPAGSGLGLAITHWIVQAHGGTVTITSREGRGTTCDVWLPAGPPGQRTD